MKKSMKLSKWHARQRLAIDELASWVRQVKWKFFCTFTFAWRVSDPQADKTFDEFIERLERILCCEICFVRGDEKSFSGCGKPASGRHFHVLLTCLAPVQTSLIESLWKSMAGNRSDNAGALVEEYNASEAGERYIFKSIHQPDGDWTFRNLELFHPEAREAQKPNKRWRRRLRRFSARQSKFASTIDHRTERD